MKEKGKTPESFSKDDVCAASTVRRACKRGTMSIRLAHLVAGYLDVPVTSFADLNVAVKTEKNVVLTYPLIDGKNARDVGLAIVASIEKMSKKEKDDGKNRNENYCKNRKEVEMGKQCKRKKKLKKKIAKLCGYCGELMPTLAMEECGELVRAISKVERGQSTSKKLAEEMAGVIIALEAIRVYYGIDEKDIVRMMEKEMDDALIAGKGIQKKVRKKF